MNQFVQFSLTLEAKFGDVLSHLTSFGNIS